MQEYLRFVRAAAEPGATADGAEFAAPVRRRYQGLQTEKLQQLQTCEAEEMQEDLRTLLATAAVASSSRSQLCEKAL